MPVLTRGLLNIDYTDEGEGVPVILIHSSVSGNRQWHALSEALKDRYRVLAINLFGYGKTTPWRGDAPQTLADQAGLILALGGVVNRPLFLVGHSFGGSVALKAAALAGNQVAGLVLLEPNPFHLLARGNRWEAYAEARALRDYVKQYGASGEWRKVAERFADYWAGDGTWIAMSAKRQAAFVEMLPNNFHEWDAVMDETTPIDEWKRLAARTLVVHAADTRRPIREIVELFQEACPHWAFKEIAAGGHMAPLTHPELVNPHVAKFLDSFRNQ